MFVCVSFHFLFVQNTKIHCLFECWLQKHLTSIKQYLQMFQIKGQPRTKDLCSWSDWESMMGIIFCVRGETQGRKVMNVTCMNVLKTQIRGRRSALLPVLPSGHSWHCSEKFLCLMSFGARVYIVMIRCCSIEFPPVQSVTNDFSPLIIVLNNWFSQAY